ncbi:hypothetical protein [Glycomyces rhizosphaerae]|uniref:Uncharacterized protein n=1 Tax=Glycomyces rhizosphaerae TaxID=2054422 RepID=A0ABV7Q4N5_9ACTN
MNGIVKLLVVAVIGLAFIKPGPPKPRKPGGGPTPTPPVGGFSSGRAATASNLDKGAAGGKTPEEIQAEIDAAYDAARTDKGSEDDAYDERDGDDADDPDDDGVDPNGTDLSNEQVADRIAAHADQRSIPGVPDDQVADYIKNIMSVPGTKMRPTPSGTPRWGWWDPQTGTMIIREGNNGTFMQPSRKYEYYQEQVQE